METISERFIVDLKKNINVYKKYLFKGSDYKSELDNINDEFNSLKDLLDQLNNLYTNETNEFNKRKLEEYLYDEKSYLELINMYINELSGYINRMSEDEIIIVRKYLELITEINDIENKRKEFENYSREASNHSMINYVETESLTGSKISISDNFLNNYQDLIKQQIDKSKEMKKIYNLLSIIKEKTLNNNDISDSFDRIVRDINQEINYYNNMTLEEKYKDNLERLRKIEECAGSKQDVSINGEIRSIPCIYVGQYGYLISLNNKLEQEIYLKEKNNRDNPKTDNVKPIGQVNINESIGINKNGIKNKEDIDLEDKLDIIEIKVSKQKDNLIEKINKSYPIFGTLLGTTFMEKIYINDVVLSNINNGVDYSNNVVEKSINIEKESEQNNNIKTAFIILEKNGEIVNINVGNPDAELKITILIGNGYKIIANDYDLEENNVGLRI